MDWLEKAIWPAEAKLTNELVEVGTRLGIAEMFRSGTTCFSDMYFFMNDTAKVVKETGIRAVLSRGMAGVAPTAEQAWWIAVIYSMIGTVLTMTVSK